jgi:transcriptional regulator with XRE-family HTH domain
MTTEQIKRLIKKRGYTTLKVARMLGYTLPTLEKLMEKRPNIVEYAVMGLPEMTHNSAQRIRILRGSTYEK